MAYKKVVIPGNVDKDSNRAFKTKKYLPNEKDIYIIFDSDVDYVIEKLSIEGLPTETNDKRTITWHNNFVIQTKAGTAVTGITYKVLIDAPDGATIVYYDESGLHIYQNGINQSSYQNKSWKEIKLSKGDPAIGIAT